MLSDTTEEAEKLAKTLTGNKASEREQEAGPSKVAKSLAKNASKKNVKSSDPSVLLKTRKMSALKPENQKRLKKFNLKNFNQVENKQELRFMGHEMVKMLNDKMEALKLDPEEKAAEVTFFLKFFQSAGVFAHCDSLVFCNVGNTVSR